MNIICFGQQPCGFFPKRYLVAKINTAKKLQVEIGGKIVFFYHDSDADYRETITVMRDRQTGAEVRLNFTQENKLQKKHSPLYAKRIPVGWKEEILKQLPRFVDQPLMDLFSSIDADNAADFCLEMYKNLRVLIRANNATEKRGLLDGIEIIRSSDKDFRNQTCDIQDGFADVEYKNEIVRAKLTSGKHFLTLHEGDDVYTKIPFPDNISKAQISPGAKDRFKWMQSVIHCTHYIYGEGEKEYLHFGAFPEVKFIQRDETDQPEYAWIK